MAYVDRGVHVFGGIRGSSFASPWWLTWITVHKHLVGDGVAYKPLVACVDRRLQAFGGMRGLSFTNLLVRYVDGHVVAFGGIRGLWIASLW